MDSTESRNTTVESKVIIHKSRGEVSLVALLTIDCVPTAYFESKHNSHFFSKRDIMHFLSVG